MSFVGSQSATRVRIDPASEVDPSTGLPDQTEQRTETDIVGTYNPDSGGEDAEITPTGEVTTEFGVFITKTELRPADDSDPHPPDYLEFRGKTFEVVQVSQYERVIPHFEATIVRVS